MKKYLAVLVVCLFLSTSVTVMSENGFSEEDSESLDVLFDRMDIESYHEYYKEYFSEEIDESCISDDIGLELGICYDSEDVGSTDDNGLMDSSWPMKAQNLRHTGLSPYSTEGNNGVIRWKYESRKWIDGGPIIDDMGNIYFGTQGGKLYALHPDGSLKWKSGYLGPIWSTPTIAKDGTVYIGTFDNILYAFNSDGTLKWEYRSGGSITSSPAIANDGTIYFGTMGFPENGGCKIICLYPNGTKKWDYQTGYKIVCDAAIGDDGTIYIGSGDYYFYAINPNGTLKWRFKTGDIVKSHASIADDGTIYFDSFDNYLYALYPNGTLKWKFKGVASGCGSASMDEDGIIYISGKNVNAIYPNGTRKWKYTLGDKYDAYRSSPAISSDGTLYIAVTYDDVVRGYIYAFDSETGSLLWRKEIANNWVDSSPCIGKDGTVYIGSASDKPGGESYGILYAFRRNEINQPPNPPEIMGPSQGVPLYTYTYNFTVSDPDLDQFEIYVDWGDSSNSGWVGPYDSGSTVTLYHEWSEKGTFLIQAKARDTYDGSESEWSTLSVSMPKTKQYHSVFFQWLFSLSNDLLLRVLNLKV